MSYAKLLPPISFPSSISLDNALRFAADYKCNISIYYIRFETHMKERVVCRIVESGNHRNEELMKLQPAGAIEWPQARLGSIEPSRSGGTERC